MYKNLCALGVRCVPVPKGTLVSFRREKWRLPCQFVHFDKFCQEATAFLQVTIKEAFQSLRNLVIDAPLP